MMVCKDWPLCKHTKLGQLIVLLKAKWEEIKQ